MITVATKSIKNTGIWYTKYHRTIGNDNA